jgi:hypothetical protein
MWIAFTSLAGLWWLPGGTCGIAGCVEPAFPAGRPSGRLRQAAGLAADRAVDPWLEGCQADPVATGSDQSIKKGDQDDS